MIRKLTVAEVVAKITFSCGLMFIFKIMISIDFFQALKKEKFAIYRDDFYCIEIALSKKKINMQQNHYILYLNIRLSNRFFFLVFSN